MDTIETIEIEPDENAIRFSEDLPPFLEFTGNRGYAMPDVRTVLVNGRCYAFRGIVTAPDNLRGWIVFSRNLQFGYDRHIHFAPPSIVEPTTFCPNV